MSVLDDVFRSLNSMGQWQLLLAFVGCMAYAFAQGSLLLPRGRRWAWAASAVAAAAFILECRDWTHATMLLGFAVAGLGSFAGLVWLLCRAIGFGRATATPQGEWSSTAPAALAGSSARASRHHEPAHSHF